MDCEVVALDWRQKSLDPFHEFGIVWRLWRTIRRTRPAVCFSFTFKANFDIGLAGKSFKLTRSKSGGPNLDPIGGAEKRVRRRMGFRSRSKKCSNP